MLRISWGNKVKNTDTLIELTENEQQLYRNIARQKIILMQDTCLEEVARSTQC